METMRVRLTFAKTAHMRYTGNLDLHRTLERTFRRARLPISYSEGFTPRIRLNIASALPLGFTSEGELADIWLDERLDLDVLGAAIQAAAPPGVVLTQLEEMPIDAPKLQNIVETAEYTAQVLEPESDLENRTDQLMAADQILRERRGKAYDLKPLLLDLKVIAPAEDGSQMIWMHLTAQSGATGRPDEVAAALGIDPHTALFHRTRLHLRSWS